MPVNRHGGQGLTPAAMALLVVLIVLWGGNYTWVKVAVRDVDPWTFNALRYVGATALVAGVLAFAGGSRDLLPPRGERTWLAITGLLQAGVTTGASAIALQWIEASRVVLILYSMPVWTLPLSYALLGERVTLLSLTAAVLGFAGIALLTNPFAMPWTGDAVPGIVMSLVGVLAWALGAVLYRRRRWTSTFWQQTLWQLGATAALFVPIALLHEASRPISFTPPMLAVLAYNIVGPVGLGFWCWSLTLARLGATTASQFLLLSPVFGMWQSHVVLGEPLGAWIWASAAAIVLGAWLAIASRA